MGLRFLHPPDLPIAVIARPLPAAFEQPWTVRKFSWQLFPSLQIQFGNRDHQQAFSIVAAWNSTSFNLANDGRSRITKKIYFSGDFFRTLGVAPAAGRITSPADDTRGCGLPAAVISCPFRQRECAGNLSAVASKLTLGGHPAEIIGVTPAGFYGPRSGLQLDCVVE